MTGWAVPTAARSATPEPSEDPPARCPALPVRVASHAEIEVPVLLLRSGILLTSFLAGIVALLAPCCISVMLPAYFASGLRRRRRVLAMTVIFAAGVATVILPIALGASLLSRLINAHHTPVFATGGLLMLLAGAATLAGRSLRMPMPISAPLGREGAGSTFALGAFSGIATACCAPVLAGVAGLAGAAGSFPLALAIGAAYVFGMVAPLAVLALMWDVKDWGRLLPSERRVLTVPLGRRRIRLPLVNALAGTILLAMGALTLRSAFTGPGMSNSGWQIHLTATLNHVATRLEHQLSILPGWVATGLVIALASAFGVAGRRLSRRDRASLAHAPVAAIDPTRTSPGDRRSDVPDSDTETPHDRKSALR